MKFTYEIIVAPNDETIVLRSDGAYIPKDEANSDYQRYLRWLENPDADENGTIS
jgi:hypothetical protein